MKGFVWRLICPKCTIAFDPFEGDMDFESGINCPKCMHNSHIDIEYAPIEIDINLEDDMRLNAPGDHHDWPENLSDWELDQVYKSIDMVPEHFETIMKEYQRRGKVPPRKA